MTGDQLLGLVVGVSCLVLTWVCWSGRWNKWADWRLPTAPRAVAITFAPGVGVMAISSVLWPPVPGILRDIVGTISMLSVVSALVLAYWDPDWFGPRWYRDFKRAFVRGDGSHFWLEEDPCQAGESSVDATRRHMSGARPDPRSQQARLVRDPGGLAGPDGLDGKVWFYPQAPVFTAPGAHERSVHGIIPVETLQRVGELPDDDPELRAMGYASSERFTEVVRVDTDGGAWLFECGKGKDLVREIERRYLPSPAAQPR